MAFRSQLTFLVEKDSAAGKALYEVLKDGRSHLVVVKIKGPSQESFFKKECVVVEFVQDGWVLP